MEELPLSKASTTTEPERNYFCAYCGTAITSEGQRTEKEGSFSHTFTNPGGYVFGIGCFRRAPGCMDAGDYTDEHTWFPGYQWCYALCCGCTSHLGWRYESKNRGAFYGLILDRLIAPAT